MKTLGLPQRICHASQVVRNLLQAFLRHFCHIFQGPHSTIFRIAIPQIFQLRGDALQCHGNLATPSIVNFNQL